MNTKKIYTALFLDSVKDFITDLSETDSAKVAASITIIEKGDLHLVDTKMLKAPIRELKIKKYRFIFFIHKNLIYIIHAFIKKTAKTPQKEIGFAEKVYKMIINK